MGRRIVAFVVDWVVVVLASLVFWQVAMEIRYDANPVSEVSVFDDTVYVSDSPRSFPFGAFFLASALVHVVLQGLKGFTPGKLLTGIRTVRADGRPPGIPRALVRWVLWIVDGAPWCLPIVGFLVARNSRGHRRVGDMAAQTFVVRRKALPAIRASSMA